MTEAPRTHKKPEKQPNKGILAVFTGEGKGKTTAAIGTAIRALGSGKKVAIIQFIKNEWTSGEEIILEKHEKCHFFKIGGGFTWDTKNRALDVSKARKGLNYAEVFIKNNSIDLVILDEILCCIDYGFLKEEDLLQILAERPKMQHVILTGRGASESIKEKADLVTEMRCVKHPYDKGIWAQKGFDY